MPSCVVGDLVGTDVLRDAAVLARHDVGLADGIEQPGLTVVNVTHDGDNRRTCLEVFVAFGFQLGFEVDVEAWRAARAPRPPGDTTCSL